MAFLFGLWSLKFSLALDVPSFAKAKPLGVVSAYLVPEAASIVRPLVTGLTLGSDHLQGPRHCLTCST